MNPLKRRASDTDSLPIHHRPTKRANTRQRGLTERWWEAGRGLAGLVFDTMFAVVDEGKKYFFGESEEPADTRQCPTPSPTSPSTSSPPSPSRNTTSSKHTMKQPQRPEQIPLPPSPPLTSSPTESAASLPTNPSHLPPSQVASTSKLPPPPPRATRRLPTTSKAGPSTVTRADGLRQPKSVRTALPTPPPSDSSPSTSSILQTVKGMHPQFDEILATLPSSSNSPPKPKRKIKHRPHIFHSQFKAGVKEQLQRTREEMEKELYVHKQKTTGIKVSFTEFRSWLGYRELLEKKARDQGPAVSLSNPPEPLARLSEKKPHPVASTDFLHRALRDARKSLVSPKPAVATPQLSELFKAYASIDSNIDGRIRPKRPPLPASLPKADDQKVDELMRQRGTIAKCNRQQVSDKDLSRLRPGQWLNDEIINFYGEMIMARAEAGKENSKQGVLNVHYFSTFFWSTLTDKGYEKGRLAKWTKKFDLFSKDVVLIPVNHSNAHWTAAAINFRQKRIESYDSMGMNRSNVYKHLRAYLDAEHRNKRKKPFDFTGWVDYVHEDVPQQENGYDCGVFTCQFLESLSRGEESFAFTQANMTYLRRRMIWEIGHSRLRDDS